MYWNGFRRNYRLWRDKDGFYQPWNVDAYKDKYQLLRDMENEMVAKQHLQLYKPFFNPAITPSDKKYSVMVLNDKGEPHIIHFGDTNYEHYEDKTGLGVWSHLDHHDPVRRKNFLKRARGIKDQRGRLTWKNKNSPNYYSVQYLW